MATRSTIALEFADGTVGQVYCHWDGYLDNNGRILLEHYTDPFKLRKLIDLGDLSSLDTQIGSQHDFDERVNECTFYGRDRGESDTQARYYKDFSEYASVGQSEEYDYILRQINGEPVWFVRSYATHDEFVRLDKAFVMEKEYTE